ncbi:hypothetical protein ACFE04_024818 [Oxalis oulophora]
MSNEWLQTGNCPIAKSYRAVSGVLPLVAKVMFQLPPGMKYVCPAPIVKARAVLSRTAFAKNLRPQPLPAKVVAIGLLAVPFIAMLRKSVLMPKSAMAFTIAASPSILGQVIGSRAERYRVKAITAKKTGEFDWSDGRTSSGEFDRSDKPVTNSGEFD